LNESWIMETLGSTPHNQEQFQEFAKAIVAKVKQCAGKQYYQNTLLKELMDGLQLGKVVSEKMYDRWFALEQKVKELNEQLKESGNSDGTKVVEMKIQMNAVKAENCLLQNRQRKHEEIISNLSKKVVHKKDLAEFIHTHLKPHLTLGQVKAYLRGDWQRARKITAEDYQRAKTLLEISPKAFEYLRRTKQLPLPSQSGLRMYESKHDMDGMTRDAVASIEMAEFCEAPPDAQIQGMPGNNLAQLASLAVIKQEPLSKLAKMCKQCLEGTCEVSAKTGEPCMPPEKGPKRKRPAKKKFEPIPVPEGASMMGAPAGATQIIMHRPEYVQTEVKPSIVFTNVQI